MPVLSDRRQGLVTARGHWMRAGGMTCDIRGPPLQLLGRSFIIRQNPDTHPPGSSLTKSPLQRDPTAPPRAYGMQHSSQPPPYPLFGLSTFRPPCCSSILPHPQSSGEDFPGSPTAPQKGHRTPCHHRLDLVIGLSSQADLRILSHCNVGTGLHGYLLTRDIIVVCVSGAVAHR